MLTPASSDRLRSSSMSATPAFLMVCFMKLVAIDSNPGTVAWIRFGMFHWMPRNHFGPNGIFIGIAGLPSGLTCASIFFFSRLRP